jgi:hypothetical protein
MQGYSVSQMHYLEDPVLLAFWTKEILRKFVLRCMSKRGRGVAQFWGLVVFLRRPEFKVR